MCSTFWYIFEENNSRNRNIYIMNKYKKDENMSNMNKNMANTTIYEKYK